MFATVPARAGSFLLDLVIVLAVTIAVGAFTEIGYWKYAVPAAYFIGFPLTPWQGTPGKRYGSLKITQLSGAPIGLGRSMVRFVVSVISFAALGAGYAVSIWNGKRRTLHDFAAGTVVVDAKATPAEIAAATAPSPSWTARISQTAAFVIVAVVPGILVAIFLGITTGAHNRSTEINARNMGEAAPVVAALHAYRARNGRYPQTLAALHPEYVPRVPKLDEGSYLYYASSPDGDRCWLAIALWHIGNLVLPSDMGNEYDCVTRTWRVDDIGQLNAKFEYGFGK